MIQKSEDKLEGDWGNFVFHSIPPLGTHFFLLVWSSDLEYLETVLRSVVFHAASLDGAYQDPNIQEGVVQEWTATDLEFCQCSFSVTS